MDLMFDFLFCMFLITIFVLSLWLIDISASALTVGGSVTNIFGVRTDPNFTYHLGFVMAIISFIILISFLFYARISLWFESFKY